MAMGKLLIGLFYQDCLDEQLFVAEIDFFGVGVIIDLALLPPGPRVLCHIRGPRPIFFGALVHSSLARPCYRWVLTAFWNRVDYKYLFVGRVPIAPVHIFCGGTAVFDRLGFPCLY